MKSVPRFAVVLVAALATFYFVFWLPVWFLLPLERWPSVRIVRIVGGLLCSVGAARFVWRWQRGDASLPTSLAGNVIAGAVITGVVGFAAGFVGPMIFAPGANQGPLLGILITGPLGLVLGAIGGGAYWRIRGAGSVRDVQ